MMILMVRTAGPSDDLHEDALELALGAVELDDPVAGADERLAHGGAPVLAAGDVEDQAVLVGARLLDVGDPGDPLEDAPDLLARRRLAVGRRRARRPPEHKDYGEGI